MSPIPQPYHFCAHQLSFNYWYLFEASSEGLKDFSDICLIGCKSWGLTPLGEAVNHKQLGIGVYVFTP